MLAPTHVLFALAIAYLLRFPKIAAVIGGIIPDLDVLLQMDFPLMHRGIIHTPFFVVVSIVFLYLVTDSPTTFGFGAGFLAHLMLDVITPTGILLLYPLPYFLTLGLATYDNMLANIGLIGLSLGAIFLYRSGKFQGWVSRVFGIALEPREAHP